MLDGRVAIVAGASGGIGLELARVFAREGYGLVLVARNETRLRDLAGELKTETLVIAKDLTKAGAAQEVFDQVRQVDVLVNNAVSHSSRERYTGIASTMRSWKSQMQFRRWTAQRSTNAAPNSQPWLSSRWS